MNRSVVSNFEEYIEDTRCDNDERSKERFGLNGGVDANMGRESGEFDVDAKRTNRGRKISRRGEAVSDKDLACVSIIFNTSSYV